MLVISFRNLKESDQKFPVISEEVGKDQIIRQLEEELSISNDKLQSTIEDLESANEELKSSNEELMSMNEELQSTNEELETSQEELQALNEELSTVNAELQSKISELDSSKSDLENLLNASDIATIFIDKHYIIRQFTPAASNIFNLVPGDVGRPLEHFTGRIPGKDVLADSSKVLTNLKVIEKEISSDEGRCYQARYFPYLNQNNLVDGVVLTYYDISSRKAMEREIKVSNERLALALSATGAGIYDHHIPLNDKTYHSEEWAAVLGYKKDELPDYKNFLNWLTEQVHPESRDHLNEAYEDFVGGRNESYDVEIQIRHKKGNYIWVRDVSKAVERNKKGKAIRIVGLIFDITEKKAIEQELQKKNEELEEHVKIRTAALFESQARMKAIIDNFPNGSVLLFDHDLRYLVASGEALYATGYLPETLVDKPLSETVDKDLFLQLEQVYREALKGKKSRIEISDRGEIFDVWVLPVYNEKDQIIAGMVMTQIISTEKKLQKELLHAKEVAELANQAKSSFLANMSHEIRTPLNGILGNAQLLKEELPDKTDLLPVENILDAGKQLMSTIDDILDISRIEAGQVKIKFGAVQVKELVNRVFQFNEKQAEAKKLEFAISLSDEIPETIESDAKILIQILNNLISNAIKFTQKGKVELRIQCDDCNQSRILFSVSDTGIGVAESHKKKIFTTFFQIENYRVKGQQGTGLGLAITQKLLHLLGSEISLDSELGKGSTFSFILNVKVSDGKAVNLTDNENKSALKDITGLKVLLVEDTKVNQYFVKKILTKSGCLVTTADNGNHAMKLIRDNEFDVVLMDVQMPDMDGMEATRLIRDLNDKSKKSLKIIAMTAYAMKGDKERFLESGMDDYISKPLDMNLLKLKLSELKNPPAE